ncbi:hypothetical protein GW756_05160 [bacterium]|nr:hypothetical protein [bacterium]NCQ55767.1 hypothetical protein [Candidatus Parcubacteria bacterium]NCS67716.1 hypothetical protein [Candidatus Peregrinibacteria bacterium]NCS96730.1 hypothetical protein [bacterium]
MRENDFTERSPETEAQALAFKGFGEDIISAVVKADITFEIEGETFSAVNENREVSYGPTSFKLYHHDKCLGAFMVMHGHRLYELIMREISEAVPTVLELSAEDFAKIDIQALPADHESVRKIKAFWEKGDVVRSERFLKLGQGTRKKIEDILKSLVRN